MSARRPAAPGCTSRTWSTSTDDHPGSIQARARSLRLRRHRRRLLRRPPGAPARPPRRQRGAHRPRAPHPRPRQLGQPGPHPQRLPLPAQPLDGRGLAPPLRALPARDGGLRRRELHPCLRRRPRRLGHQCCPARALLPRARAPSHRRPPLGPPPPRCEPDRGRLRGPRGGLQRPCAPHPARGPPCRHARHHAPGRPWRPADRPRRQHRHRRHRCRPGPRPCGLPRRLCRDQRAPARQRPAAARPQGRARRDSASSTSRPSCAASPSP